jgi:lambda family phage portal protein
LKRRLNSLMTRAVDRAIGVFAPGVELARATARAQTDAINSMAGSYEAARRSRLNRDWIPTLGSADTDTLYDLDKLRADSRDLRRNDGYAQVITGMVNHVVGPGLLPHASINVEALGISDEEAEIAQEQQDTAFHVWCDGADSSGLYDFAGMQELAYGANVEDGETFARRIALTPAQMKAAEAPYSAAYALIDADRIKSPSRQIIDQVNRSNGNRIRHGIEYDAAGRRTQFWVLKEHPAEKMTGYRREDFFTVPASEMLHLFRPLRVGQTRGVPYLAPEMDTFRMLDRLFEAELVTALVVACHSIFIRKNNPDDGYDSTLTTQSDGQKVQQLEPGMVTYLGRDEEPFSFNPNRPGNTFPPFVEILLRKMSTGLNVPYEFLAKDFTKTTFSGGRLSVLLAHKFFDSEQKRVVRQFCRPIRMAVLREAMLRGDVAAPMMEMTPARLRMFLNASWSGPGYAYVDPEVEIGAARDGISAGLSTLARECAVTGQNWREVMDELAREKKRAAKLGLDLAVFRPEPGSPVTTTTPAPGAPRREPGKSPNDEPRATRRMRAVA